MIFSGGQERPGLGSVMTPETTRRLHCLGNLYRPAIVCTTKPNRVDQLTFCDAETTKSGIAGVIAAFKNGYLSEVTARDLLIGYCTDPSPWNHIRPGEKITPY